MEAVIHQLLDMLEQRPGEVFFVQIGAMDGVSFDPLHSRVIRYGWQGLLVEPVKEHFERLKANYHGIPGMIFENVAITDEPGPVTLYRVPDDAVAAHGLPDWVRGVGSLYRDRNAIGGAECPPALHAAISKQLVEETVQGTTLDELLDRNAIARIDLLQMDTEGHDYRILRQLDFDRYRPTLINLEFRYLPEEEKRACVALLSGQGYRLGLHGHSDLIAVAR